MNIVDYIPVGRENAVSMPTLSVTLGADERTTRLWVHNARKHGEPICSVCNGGKCGYYMPRNIEEAKVYLRQQKARLKSSRAALNGVVKFVREAERSEKNGK